MYIDPLLHSSLVTSRLNADPADGADEQLVSHAHSGLAGCSVSCEDGLPQPTPSYP